MSVAFPIPELSAVQAAFGADALEWMPPMATIPEEFKKGRTEWNQITSAWFFSGLPASTVFVPRAGVDKDAALRALGATLGSYAPKHEHKEAAVAYMMSCWFKKVRGWKKPA